MISGIVTAVLLTAFIVICIWAWSGANRGRFEDASKLPLSDEHRDCCRGERS